MTEVSIWASFGAAHVAQSVEHILGKDEVTGSNPVMGSILFDIVCGSGLFVSANNGSFP